MSQPLALIIEDDKDSARLYTRIMEPFGYKFDFAASKDAAISRLDKVAPSLVLLDLSLVRRKLDDSGIVILNKIRTEKRFADTQVIIISAYSKLVDQLQDDADGVIIKPVKAKKLVALIEGLQELRKNGRT